MCGAFSFQTGNRRRKSRLVAKRSGGQNRRRRRCLFRRVVTKVWLSSLIMKPEIVDLWPMVKTGAVLTPRNRSPHILRTLLVFLPCRWCCTMSTNSLFTPAFFTVKRPFPCGLWTNQDVPATNQVSPPCLLTKLQLSNYRRALITNYLQTLLEQKVLNIILCTS